MDFKILLNKFIRPHVAVVAVVTPVAIAALVLSAIFLDSASPISIISYVLSAYALTVWCFRVPDVISFFKAFRKENPLMIRWREDDRFRVTASLYGSLILNTAYALFQLWLGIYHRTFWYYSLAVYYILLAVMRFFLLRHTRAHTPGERMESELVRYRACGYVFLLINLALSIIIFFMIYWDRTFKHHEITTIAMAAYTFTAMTLAIISIIKYRKYNSPIYSAAKAISLASACVSMLTLEATMLTAFGEETLTSLERKIFLGLSGAAVSAVVIALAIYMIIIGTKKIKKLRSEVKINGAE